MQTSAVPSTGTQTTNHACVPLAYDAAPAKLQLKTPTTTQGEVTVTRNENATWIGTPLVFTTRI